MKIQNTLKRFGLLFVFIGTFIYSELILRTFIGDSFLNLGLLFIVLFSLPVSFIIFAFLKLFKEKTCKILTFAVLGIIFLFYSSQMVYYRIFKTFYTFYSFANGKGALKFVDTLVSGIISTFVPIILLSLPIVLMGIFVKKLNIFSFEKNIVFIGVGSAVLLHLLVIAILYLTPHTLMSAYNLYFRTNAINQSVNKLGLFTTARLDVQRYFFGTPETTVEVFEPEDTSSKEEIVTETVYEENVMDIDFDSLIENEQNKTLLNMHRYFSSQTPSLKNEMTGIFEGCNLIFITAESFAPYAIDENLTPTLYKLYNEGFKFNNYYHPLWGVSTLDGEYVNSLSLVPKTGVWSMYLSHKNLLPFSLGNQFKGSGYKTYAFHNHEYDYYSRNISHPNLGYDVYKALGNGLNVTPTWPESDLQMVELSYEDFINDEQFMVYYLTVSGHMGYTYLGNSIATKNRHLVKELDMSEGCQAYLACNIELDRALEKLLNELESANKLDNTVIALVPDHYPYALSDEDISAFLGHEVEKNFEIYKNTFILYKKGIEPSQVDKLCSSFDVLPTLLNMFGFEYDSRLLMGRDIFSTSSPLVFFEDRCWITDKCMYNPNTNKVIPLSDEEVTQEYITRINAIVSNKFTYSQLVLEKDYYRKVLE